MTVIQTLSSTLPIIFLVIAGILLRITGLLQASSINDLKKLIINVALPLLLFKAFATMLFEPRFLVIVLAVFLACTGVMFLSAKFNLSARPFCLVFLVFNGRV